MSNVSVCRSFSCPYWSDGKNPDGGGSIGGYGCTKFSVAGHCPVSQVKDVTDTQYELFVREGGSQNQGTMIALGIAHLVFRDIELPDQRGARANHIKFSKDSAA